MREIMSKIYKELENMTLDEGDKAMCAEIARDIIEKVLAEHIKTCPVKQTILRTKLFLIGICVGSGFASGGLVLTLGRFSLGS